MFNSECPIGNVQTYWTCCTIDSKCEEGEGDCDNNSECIGDLVCGTDNCLGSEHPQLGDCCEKPTPSTTTTTAATTPTTTWPDGMFKPNYSKHIFSIGMYVLENPSGMGKGPSCTQADDLGVKKKTNHQFHRAPYKKNQKIWWDLQLALQ